MEKLKLKCKTCKLEMKNQNVLKTRKKNKK